MGNIIYNSKANTSWGTFEYFLNYKLKNNREKINTYIKKYNTFK